MTSEVLRGFPSGFSPNKSQIKLLNGIQEAFNQGYKFIVCCAPTGSGKSFVTKTLGNNSESPTDAFRELITSYTAFKQTHTGGYTYEDDCEEEPAFGAFALTITKTLQDQYKGLFSDINILKGKTNYQCAVDDRYNVETAPCVFLKSIKDDCWNKNKCPYYNARNDALVSRLATLNYNMFFSLPKHIKKREFLICDEASELEDQLVKQFSCSIRFDFLKKNDIKIQPFEGKTHATVNKWLSGLVLRINDRVEDLKDQVQGEKNINRKNSKINELIQIRNLHAKLTTILDTWSECEYIYETTHDGVSFTPLRVDNLSKYIFNYGDKIILMSATIIDHKNFCKSLGIEKYKYIEVDSSFDPKNAPIYVNTKTKLSFNNLKQNLPKIKKQIIEICEHHKNDKGLIHTHTNTITSYLKSQISGNRFLFREPGINNESLLDKHYNTKEPTVVVSPSMSHGVDLKDDLARFQIIVKAPFLPMKDKRIEKLMRNDTSWYINKMLSAFIQSCGRGVRAADDHCVTYILDGTIIEKVIENKDKLPKYFLDRFV
jgi:Rad3-related DNA helicase